MSNRSNQPRYLGRAGGSKGLAFYLICSLVIAAFLGLALGGCAQISADGAGPETPAGGEAAPTPYTTKNRLPDPPLVFPPGTCEPPCWQGITPGRGTITDTIALLGEPDRVDGLVVPAFTPPITVTSWGVIVVPVDPSKFPGADNLLPKLPQIEVWSQKGIVRGISLNDADSTDTLADVVARYGPPEYTVLSRVVVPPHVGEFQYWKTVIHYPSRGMSFSTDYVLISYIWRDDSMPPVSKGDRILTRNFYEPTTLAGVQENWYGQSWGAEARGHFVEWADIPD